MMAVLVCSKEKVDALSNPLHIRINMIDRDVILAVFANILSWIVAKWFPSWLPHLLPKIEEEDTEVSMSSVDDNRTRCIPIGRPGGKEQLRLITLKPKYVTCGYNTRGGSSFIRIDGGSMKGIVVRIHSFSINYADCCIRWGLYESANKFVGWPIVPGFDIAGVVEEVIGDHQEFKVGDKVFGATFFGAYSTRAFVPANQLRKIPEGLTMAEAASIPAVSLTALYSLRLGGQFPMSTSESSRKNRSILIHSAAGGVGSMLVQMSKLLGLSPIVGVVGRSSKVDAAKALGCDVVIDKSQENLWEVASKASPDGYIMICDANGVSTLHQSYMHLAPTGRLIVFGFHTNLPMGNDMLSPLEWLRMAVKMATLPKFDAMDLTTSNKSVMGFNLSFFTEEIDLMGELYDQIGTWISEGKLECPRIVEMGLENVDDAHELIQSGKSVGKIIINTGAK